jgi:ABC-type transport system involved in cytochrome bd biosynthesis fused ATPase/permease subunit
MLISSLIDRILIFITNDTYQLNRIKNILIIENQKVVGFGSHNALIKSSPEYSNFYLESHKNIVFAE